ncbi:MAG TPA: hypothetical protein VM096_03645 [Vicinamibacterales bacterium]|nr:hypothetical protein [Vicinamibacterales bacterium]
MSHRLPDHLERRSAPRPDYPSRCPRCEKPAAKPKSASTVPGQPLAIRLEMLCGGCAHQWTQDKLDQKFEP